MTLKYVEEIVSMVIINCQMSRFWETSHTNTHRVNRTQQSLKKTFECFFITLDAPADIFSEWNVFKAKRNKVQRMDVSKTLFTPNISR